MPIRYAALLGVLEAVGPRYVSPGLSRETGRLALVLAVPTNPVWGITGLGTAVGLNEITSYHESSCAAQTGVRLYGGRAQHITRCHILLAPTQPASLEGTYVRFLTAISIPVICCLVATSACSTFITHFPEPADSGEDCVGQYIAPTTDMALGLGSVAVGAVALSSEQGEGSFRDLGAAMTIAAFALGLYGVVSGSYGFAAVGACKQQRAVCAAKAGSW